MRNFLFVLLLLPAFVKAQSPFPNTLSWNESTGSPPAELTALSWIEGHWRGEAFGGIVEEIWSPALGGSMMGSFKLVNDGQVSFYELETIVEEQGTLILRLKHFHGNLKGWEEKDETVDFRLVKVTKDKVFFEGFTFERIGKNNINLYVVVGDEGKASEVTFAYTRVNPVPEQKENLPPLHSLANPLTEAYLLKALKGAGPKLILSPPLLKQLKKKLASDPVVSNYYRAIKHNADNILQQPLLSRTLIGRRLLSTSREMLYRMSILSTIYVVEKDPDILRRIEEELIAVCQFEDWNPSHFLDVGEMCMAVALATDWVGKGLSSSTRELVLTALINKGIKPSFSSDNYSWWIDSDNNWNQVCHGGMIAASVVIAKKNPKLATQTIHRALEHMPIALHAYGPDGVYPEGATYWGYGTSFTVLTIAMLESAFDTDFGISQTPGFMESANFFLMSIAPTGQYYNFADCGDKRNANGNLPLSWFAAHTGNSLFLEKDRFLQDPERMGKLSRFAGPGLIWLSQFEEKTALDLPLAWKGEGANPVIFFRGREDDPNHYFVGAKGGKGSVNHGNIDAGSFIFELDKIRWVVDPGNQSYHALEKTGFKLWDRCQTCERWTLLTKNNFGHSTLTLNDQLHNVEGFAPLIDFQEGDKAEATFDLSAVFGGEADNSITRRFVKEGPRSLLIEDFLVLSDTVQTVVWQLMTTAEVESRAGGAILRQNGKSLTLRIDSHPTIRPSVVSLDPPPLELDRNIPGLKRIELRLPVYLFSEQRGRIRVLLSGE
ncbi:MAG: DUF6265 family protein [Bacteroidota bacterium]